VIAARRNVQSTEELVAALGMDSFFSTSLEKKKEEEALIVQARVGELTQ
jgi:hypothetical protein